MGSASLAAKNLWACPDMLQSISRTRRMKTQQSGYMSPMGIDIAPSRESE